jgi:hypothetical protein
MSLSEIAKSPVCLQALAFRLFEISPVFEKMPRSA